MEQTELLRLLKKLRRYEKEFMGVEPDGPKVAVLGDCPKNCENLQSGVE